LFGNARLWRPSNLGSSLAVWLDAEDASSITLNGSTVSQWNDKSGNGINISQAVGTQQPLYSATGPLGKQTIIFDGVDDVLFTDTGLNGLSNVSLFAVMRYVSVGGGGADLPLGIGETSSVGRVRAFFKATGGTTLGFAGWANDVTASAYNLDVGGAYHIFFAGNTKLSVPNNVFIGRDGLSTTYSTTGGSLNTTSPGFSVGSLRGNLVGTYYSNVELAEIVVAPEALDVINSQTLEGYLAWKWGLEGSLPIAHPYRDTPPVV
jgi:hypothetical protein